MNEASLLMTGTVKRVIVTLVALGALLSWLIWIIS